SAPAVGDDEMEVVRHEAEGVELDAVLLRAPGELPAFMRDFLTNTSKALQVALKVTSPIWSGKRYSAVRLLDLDAAVRKIAYTLLNPARAELTRPKEWPGVTSAVYAIGDTITVRRPNFYFSKRCPEAVELTIDPVSPEFGLSDRRQIEACNEAIESDVASTSRSIKAEAKREGRTFAGAQKVRDTPLTKRGNRRLKERNPRFATRNKELMKQAIEECKEFESAHAEAAQKFRRGEREALFPFGTYGYKVVLGVRVARSA
ncbi:MAG: hypothetical protein AAF488_14680, partial [Planctomycetota bacterium]